MNEYFPRELNGHDFMALERFHNDTRWMAEYEDLDTRDKYRYFLTEEGCRQLQQREKDHEIRIEALAHVAEGCLVFCKPRRQGAWKNRSRRARLAQSRGRNRHDRFRRSDRVRCG